MASALTHLETTIVVIGLIRDAVPLHAQPEVIVSLLDVPPVVPLLHPDLVPAPLLGLLSAATATTTLRKTTQAQAQAPAPAKEAIGVAALVASVVFHSDKAPSSHKTTRWEI